MNDTGFVVIPSNKKKGSKREDISEKLDLCLKRLDDLSICLKKLDELSIGLKRIDELSKAVKEIEKRVIEKNERDTNRAIRRYAMKNAQHRPIGFVPNHSIGGSDL